jgi:hypothetical protein
MNYLMDQSVMNFADSTARGSALGTAVAEGMVSYLNDTDNLEVYRAIGTAAPGWNSVAFRSEVEALPISGLVPVVPSSIVIATGSGSANALGQVSFTGATSVSLNGVFSSQYLNYRIVWRVNTSVSTTLVGRLRASGTDNTTASSYVTSGQYFRSNSTNAAFSGITTAWSISSINSPAVGRAMGTLDLSSPNIASQTVGSSNSSGHDVTSSMGIFAGYLHTVTTSYDGITFLPNSGTITGEIQVYGYND